MGVKYFFNNFTSQQSSLRGKGQETLETSLTKVKLSLLTLETIQNPILKYFPLVEIISLIVATLWIKMIRFLSKVVFGRRVSKDLLTTWIYDSDTKVRTWMFDPFLVRKAMKAHRTQFVWYRRLFIIFSRYSYANTMEKVSCDGDTQNGLSKSEKQD